METKNSYMQSIEESLAKCNIKIGELKSKAAAVHTEIKTGYLSQLEKALSHFK